MTSQNRAHTVFALAYISSSDKVMKTSIIYYFGVCRYAWHFDGSAVGSRIGDNATAVSTVAY